MKKSLKKIYLYSPFNKYIFYLIRTFFNVPHSVYKHLYFYGWFKLYITQNEFIYLHNYGYELENELFWNGLKGWEKNTIKYWLLFCKNSKVIFDIGANSGIFSLLAKKVNPFSCVYAFEPIPVAYNMMKRNIHKNKMNIHAVEMAISDYCGEGEIYLKKDTDFAYSVTLNKNTLSDVNFKKIKVKTITVSDFIMLNNIKQIDLIKLDIETHEPEVLMNMKNLIDVFQPIFFIEILNTECSNKIKSIFKEIKTRYYFYEIDETNDIIENQNLFSSNSRNYILIPIQKMNLIQNAKNKNFK